MLHGKGEQYWLTKTYEEKRNRALEWRFRYDEDTLDDLDISGSQGGGATYDKSFIIKQNPFPTTGKKDVDIRTIPRIGK